MSQLSGGQVTAVSWQRWVYLYFAAKQTAYDLTVQMMLEFMETCQGVDFQSHSRDEITISFDSYLQFQLSANDFRRNQERLEF